jgi:hypothetical protein
MSWVHRWRRHAAGPSHMTHLDSPKDREQGPERVPSRPLALSERMLYGVLPGRRRPPRSCHSQHRLCAQSRAASCCEGPTFVK